MSLDRPSHSAPDHLPYADPTSTLLASSCLDFLLIELVPMAYRIAAELNAREEEWMRGGAVGSTGAPQQAAKEPTDAGSVSGVGGGKTATVAESLVDEEEAREQVFFRLEGLGYRVGLGVIERFTRDKPRPTDPLDVIKLLCKDLWTLLFRKQIDNLKTNHRGIYVLTDNTFKPLSRMSFEKNLETIAKAQPFLYFPSGVLRGALAGMGIQATVQAETTQVPGATFQIRTVGAKP
ncbi:transport protein particle component [Mytilinidion resinicola]|uniref:Transport protein particle component n=1 Tax=Mytilinidion resinicola TaxID=574789 RepID=A0A6A6YPY3_9PEZI|nr:transport protein particle component [Mytilinidion resinicola]KAF2810956.1 transport protein particle component [Mytilinidion resinicola]